MTEDELFEYAREVTLKVNFGSDMYGRFIEVRYDDGELHGWQTLIVDNIGESFVACLNQLACCKQERTNVPQTN